MIETILILILVFVLGTIAGSFINCLAWRINQEETILGRSYCPKCKHTLSSFDLFPILSFAFLKGKVSLLQRENILAISFGRDIDWSGFCFCLSLHRI